MEHFDYICAFLALLIFKHAKENKVGNIKFSQENDARKYKMTADNLSSQTLFSLQSDIAQIMALQDGWK